MSSKLCDYCKRDQRFEKVPKRRHTEDDSRQTNEVDSRFLASGSLLDLLQRPGCSFCELILHHFTGLDGNLSTRSEAELLVWTYDVRLSDYSLRITWCADTLPRPGQTISFSCWPYTLQGNSIEEILGKEQIDTESLIRRINYCQSQHEHCKRQFQMNQNAYPKRVIDVNSWSLVQPSGPVKYCALSYVWGDVEMFKSTKANVNSLEEFGGLEKQKSNIPLVIQDAVLLASALGSQYLWVDALCILQDDPAELAEEISRMGSIYSQAFVTIAAASGNDAESCLPGVRSGTRSRPRTLKFIDGKPVVLQPPINLFENITETKYESRAWTYQETSLSPRCLYVCEKTIFLRCLEYVYMELAPPEFDPDVQYDRGLGSYLMDIQYDRGLGSHLMRPMNCPMRHIDTQPEDHASLAYRRYHDLLGSYLRRTTTYSSDALRAFTGILSRLNEQGFGVAIAGIPEAIFHFGILWRATDSSPRYGFPSWSWASREKAKRVSHNSYHRFNKYLKPRFDFEDCVGNYTLIDGSKCYPIRTRSLSDYENTRPTEVGGGIGLMTVDMSSASKFQLAFSAYAVGEAAFWFGGRVTEHLVELMDSGGVVFGEVFFDDPPHLPSTERSGRKLIALSKQNKPARDCSRSQFFTRLQDGDWCDWFYNVMLIVTQGEISRRLGIGHVIEEAWQRLLPVCEKFILE